ncbi:AIPR family protein [Pseudoroseomonas cervicalis]|uniref:AIPR protein n=1 Tax=Pseudoroseomonas cervicalis ATCC 49957 TaxID=525371 RepID=D5RPP2_9PROT|nr:AIPR family protein [Pseudoroseomonas cervicalis]EFH10738.1 hypothetical protein HMPREF0731_3054 [Pseudoroseomonas cervicalis ATCC 49957]
MTLEDFLNQLQTDIRERMAEGDAPPYTEMVFAELVMEHMAEIGMTSDPVVCHYAARVDRAELRLSGYAVSRDDEQLDLFVSLYDGMESVAPVPDSETTQVAGRCLAFLAKCAEGRLASRIDEANEAHELAQIIEMIFPKLDHITIHVLTDRVAKSKSFKSREVNGKTVRLEVMDIERLYRHLSEGKPRDEMVLDFKSLSGAPLPCVLIPGQDIVYSVALAALPGEALRVTYEKFGARLLEANVRSFLSATNKVNRGIRDTLRTSPEHFMAFNNGVVMIADEVGYEATADGGPGIAWLRGVQIVNGGQTTASIYFTKKKAADSDLRSVRVPAKIIILGGVGEDGEAAREVLVSNVSRFANSQSAVKVSDLSANRPFHRQLEQLSQSTFCPDGTTRWFYERAAGSYNVMLARKGDTGPRLKKLKAEFPPTKKVNKTELAKCLMTWAGFPQIASFGLQKNFERFSQLLDEEEGAARWPISSATDYKRLVAQVIVFRTVQKLVRPLVPAFQANVTVYTVALLSERLRAQIDLDRVWAEQAMTPQAVALATTWAKQVYEALQVSAAGRMVSEWAKKQDCWEYVRSLNLPEHPTT